MYMQFDENVMYLNGAMGEKAHHMGYAVAGYGSTQATGAGNTAPALPSGRVYPLLVKGATDEKVEKNTGIKGLVSWLNLALRDQLVGTGAYDGSYELGGSFTKLTCKMVEAYQTLKGLKVDGEVGKNTWKSLGYTGVNNDQGKVYTSSSSKPSSVKKQEEGKYNPYEEWYEKTWVQVTGGVLIVGVASYFLFLRK